MHRHVTRLNVEHKPESSRDQRNGGRSRLYLYVAIMIGISWGVIIWYTYTNVHTECQWWCGHATRRTESRPLLDVEAIQKGSSLMAIDAHWFCLYILLAAQKWSLNSPCPLKVDGNIWQDTLAVPYALILGNVWNTGNLRRAWQAPASPLANKFGKRNARDRGIFSE